IEGKSRCRIRSRDRAANPVLRPAPKAAVRIEPRLPMREWCGRAQADAPNNGGRGDDGSAVTAIALMHSSSPRRGTSDRWKSYPAARSVGKEFHCRLHRSGGTTTSGTPSPFVHVTFNTAKNLSRSDFE